MSGPGPAIFGVRHLSPAAARELLRELDGRKPACVLVEGPRDADDFIPHLVSEKSKPPLALLCYTAQSPVRSLLYPFAEYSPEYVALSWAVRHGARAAFMDLPASVFLSMEDSDEKSALDYDALARAQGYGDYESWWEHAFEANPAAYRDAAFAFGAGARELDAAGPGLGGRNLLREAAMRERITRVITDGIEPERIAVVCGAYHAPAIDPLAPGAEAPLTADELAALPRAETRMAAMPYSYYRLSSRSGYGAGNRAPAYYGLLWRAAVGKLPEGVPTAYLTRVARAMRDKGDHRSSADVIEAVRLAETLAALKDAPAPSLSDLHDAATATLGRGSEASLADAFARIDIGSEIGSVPEGAGLTAIQEDFRRQLSALKLERFLKAEAALLELDLRENRRVQSEDAAFLDLARSRFLMRLATIGVGFGSLERRADDAPTYSERWTLRWTPESEVSLAEGSLLGDTVELAAAYRLAERLRPDAAAASGVDACADVARDACLCGLEGALADAIAAAQGAGAAGAGFVELADAAWALSQVVEAAQIRRVDAAMAGPLVAEFFLGAALRLVDAASCDDAAARELARRIALLDYLALSKWKELDVSSWESALASLSDRDDRSPYLSGYALATLLERSGASGAVDDDTLARELSRRLSPGTPADLGASWFEGLASKNRAGLLSRLPVWKAIDDYLAALDGESFPRALVSLRRALSAFGPAEKRVVAENLGSLWGLDRDQAEHAVRSALGEAEKAKLASLADVDFDDI